MNKLIIFFAILKYIHGVPTTEPVVETPKGVIKGLPADDGGDYVAYYGIPYAVVDENNPFGPAQPHPGFNETFEAYEDGVMCPQMNGDVAAGTLQCLQLNVYVPKSASLDNTLPVMVFQHGGSFVAGSKAKENYSPKFLLRHDVIIVSVNYRVGPYGFLCLSEPGYNNQGLKDLILAHEWVKENIASFGGDVNRITAFGQSAGAMTLDALLQAKENLVHRVILQSGTITNTWVALPTNDSIPIDIAKNLGFESDNIKEALKYLSTQDVTTVIQAANELNIISRINAHPLTRPCVETVGDDVVLSDYPMNLKPKVKGMDIMIGFTNKEVMFLYPESDANYYTNYKFEEELSLVFNEINDVETIKHFYVGDEEMSENLKDVLLDYGSDFAFFYPTEVTISKMFEAGVNNLYRYVFSYEGGRNKNKISRHLTAKGAAHGDDLGYIFDPVLFKDQTPNEEDQKMIDIMTTMWTNFAKYGNPTPNTTDLIKVEWLPADSKKQTYLELGNDITLKRRPFYSRMAFWELYYKLYGNKLQSYKGQ